MLYSERDDDQHMAGIALIRKGAEENTDRVAASK